MSGALLGFRVDGEKKLLRLHGERSCASVLTELLEFLRGIDDQALAVYARRLRSVDAEHGSAPDAMDRQALQPYFGCVRGASSVANVPTHWHAVFAAYPELSGWRAGLPFMPSVAYDSCGDVSWGFLVDLDAAELQIFVNRHAHYHWRDLACTHPPYCTLSLAQIRTLVPGDLCALQELLHRHSYSDGIDPRLPLRDGVSAPFAGPGRWKLRLQLTQGRVRLLLECAGVLARLRQVGELRLDDAHCGQLLRESLAPDLRDLVLAIYGPGANLAQIARVAAHRTMLGFAPDGAGLPLLDLGLRPSFGLGLHVGPGFFDAVRSCFLQAGMNRQGWRFLIRQDHAALRFLLQFFPPSMSKLQDFTRFVNLLAHALQRQGLRPDRCQPALRGVERILERTRGKPDAMREENACIFLRAIMRAQLSAKAAVNLAHEAQDVSDFVYAHTALLRGATWPSLCRRSQAWHRALLIQVDPDKDVHWPALLPRYVVQSSLEAVELDCGLLLAEDGLEQRHCIGSYVNACATGASRVFSLRSQGKRLATLELQRGQDGNWRMMQLRGKANSVIQDPELLAAAGQVAQAYTRAVQAAEGGMALGGIRGAVGAPV